MMAIMLVLDLLSIIPVVNLVTDVIAGVIFAFDSNPKTNVFKNNVELTLAMFVIEAFFGFVPTLSLRWWLATRIAKKNEVQS